MNTIANTLAFTLQEYYYFRAELFQRVKPWSKRSFFFEEFTVEDCRTFLRFRHMAQQRSYSVWDVQIERTPSRVCIRWSEPTSPWWNKIAAKLLWPVLAAVAIGVYFKLRDLPGFQIWQYLIFLGFMAVIILGGFGFAQYQREECMRMLNALFSECARDARAKCISSEKTAA